MHQSDKVINGKTLSINLLNNLKLKIDEIKSIQDRVPCLAVILVGDDPASHIYVRNKKLACQKIGIKSIEYKLSCTILHSDLESLIDKLNQDNSVDGILLQLPLPKHIDPWGIINKISPNKDVDGFTSYNIGRLAIGYPDICPCTPHGIMHILDNIGINCNGMHAVVVGRSPIVGRPMILELINRGATVTSCNSQTRNLVDITKTADILVVAVGRPNFIHGDWIKDDAIVIDVGINRLNNGVLCGDVDFATAIDKVKFITPVPGGVGPMTVAMLMYNTFRCYELKKE